MNKTFDFNAAVRDVITPALSNKIDAIKQHLQQTWLPRISGLAVVGVAGIPGALMALDVICQDARALHITFNLIDGDDVEEGSVCFAIYIADQRGKIVGSYAELGPKEFPYTSNPQQIADRIGRIDPEKFTSFLANDVWRKVWH